LNSSQVILCMLSSDSKKPAHLIESRTVGERLIKKLFHQLATDGIRSMYATDEIRSMYAVQ